MSGKLLQIAALAIGFAVATVAGSTVVLAADTAAQRDDEIVLVITSPQPGQRLQGSVEITGYALDRRSSG